MVTRKLEQRQKKKKKGGGSTFSKPGRETSHYEGKCIATNYKGRTQLPRQRNFQRVPTKYVRSRKTSPRGRSRFPSNDLECDVTRVHAHRFERIITSIPDQIAQLHRDGRDMAR